MGTYIIIGFFAGLLLWGLGFWMGRRQGYQDRYLEQYRQGTYVNTELGIRRSSRIVPMEEVNGVLREKKAH